MELRSAHENWDELLEEVRRTIDRWFLWISVTGVIYVEPRRRSLSLRDLSDMVNRLRVVCDAGFPGMIVFEFSRCSWNTQRWNRVQALLGQFASSINASILPRPVHRKPELWIVMYRLIARPGNGVLTRCSTAATPGVHRADVTWDDRASATFLAPPPHFGDARPVNAG